MLRLVAPPVEVPPLSCWSSSPGLPPAPSCDIGESEKQVFSTVSSERKHEKKTLSLLCCHQSKNHHCRYYDIVNFILISMVGLILINWKVLQSTSCLVASENIPKYAQNIPKYPPNNPRYPQIIPKCDLLLSRLPGLYPLATSQKSKSIAPVRIQQLTNQQYPWSD